jgi:hypothetical protein
MTIILLLVAIAALLLVLAFEFMFLDFTVNELYKALKRYEAERDKK